jgi:tyrosine-protein kinase Etk/Wzc
MSKTTPDSVKAAPEQDNDEIDLLALLMVLLRGWKVIIACALLGLLLGVLYSRYVNPTFKTDALLQIDEKSSGISALGANISELVAPEVSPAQTERELIKSRMVLEPVVDLLHLDIELSSLKVGVLNRLIEDGTAPQINTIEGVSLETKDGEAKVSIFEVPQPLLNKPFTLTRSATGFTLNDGVNEFTGQLGESVTFKTLEGDIDITVIALPNNEHPISLTKHSLQSTTDALNSSLSVAELGKQTGIIQLTLTGENQEQVSRILTQVILSYENQNQARGSEQTTTTINFMEAQIPQLKQELEKSEAAFNNFREKYGTIDVSKEAELLLMESSDLDVLLNELNLKKAELSTFYTDEHPLVTQITDQIVVLLKRKQEIKEAIARAPDIQREFLKLSEDMGINREIYLTMLKNYEQLKIVRAGEIGYVRIVDMPISTHKAIAPKKLQIWILALLLGTMLGTMLVLLRNLLRNTVKDPERLESKTGVPVIATVPHSKSLDRLTKNKRSGHRLLSQVEHEGLSYEAIKSLRTFLMFGMPSAQQDEGRVILITGESPGIGKSFITANLAEVFSQLDKKILVIDGDMRLGHLHQIFTVNEDSGLNEYLSAPKQVQALQQVPVTIDVNDFIHTTSIDHIDFMPRGRQPRNPTSLLASERFAAMMTQLRQQYDYIFIDSPPILAASDAIITSQYADKVLMVTRYNQSIEGQVSYAVQQMRKANIEIDGIVLNDMRQGITDKYSYHYNYIYGHNSK